MAQVVPGNKQRKAYLRLPIAAQMAREVKPIQLKTRPKRRLKQFEPLQITKLVGRTESLQSDFTSTQEL